MRHCGIILACITLLLQSCVEPEVQVVGDRILSYERLMNGTGLEEPLPLVEFTPSAGAIPASNSFSGRLSLLGDDASIEFSLLVDDLNMAAMLIPGMRQLPPFDFEFVQADGHLIPVDVGPIPSDHAWWEFILEPGPVWDEAGDAGYSRAALPFSLKERNADCIHNGLLSFLFNNAGEVSHVAFQISNQTCRYLQFEMRGLVQADYEPGDVTRAQETVAASERYRANRMPLRPMEQLETDYVGADAAEFGSVEEIDPSDMTFFGFVIDGVHYAGGCGTPFGDYPYCDEMAVPSYSTAKSFVGGLALMLAEKQYPGTAKALIADYVPECGQDWRGVTIEHALDMTTGHYDSSEPHVDEDAAIASRFFHGEDHATKIDFACNEYPRKSEPGEHWSYQTWATYLAGTAINNRLKSLFGNDADFYNDLLVEELWKPLGLSQLARQTRRTNDAIAQPFTGFGLTLLRDDIAKLAIFLGVSDGRLNDQEVLDRGLFDAIKQRIPDDPGMQAESDRIRYNNGFRTYNVADELGCENPTWLTTMSGFGGINIVLMPNDTAYYYFSDGNVHRYLHAVRESHKIRPMCQR